MAKKTSRKPVKVTDKKVSGNSGMTRRIKAPVYKTFRVSKRIRSERQTLPSSWKLFLSSVGHLWKHKRLFLGVAFIQAALTLTFVRSFSVSASLGNAKDLLETLLSGTGGRFVTGAALFGALLGSNSVNSSVAAVYQSVLSVIMSLGIIWALRQTHAGNKVRAKDVFYKGMYPLVPFLLVLFVVAMQMLPLVVANLLYSFVFGNGLAVTMAEKVLWSMMIFLLVLLTLYMITSSIFALFIVTLPDVTPLQALRSARKLVLFRRWTVMRKLLFLPFVLLIIAAIILIPVIMFITPVAEWLYFVMGIVTFAVAHNYFYTVYRGLMK